MAIYKMNRNSHAVYRMVPFPMILTDPKIDFKLMIFLNIK